MKTKKDFSPRIRSMLFTTSWDDGYVLDQKVAKLLELYGCTGTFYVCPARQHGHAMMTEEEIRTLSQRHEIGAHSMTHPHLTKESDERREREIKGSKQWIEHVTGIPCTMFCYPYGDTNEDVMRVTERSGFIGARMTNDLMFSATNPFALPTTLQVTAFPLRRRFSHWWHFLDPLGPLRVRHSRLREIGVPIRTYRRWLTLAIDLFERARRTNQPFFHLWGHSHEIDRLGMWDDLEHFLVHVKKSGVKSVVNSALVGARDA
jgi:peptidoglycan/xylan/chitin deacetylase (PgdA/CDA1 family)